MAKRTAAGTLALAVCLSGGALALAGAANADSGFTFHAPIAGGNRYQTAVAAAEKAFPTGSKSVVVVNAQSTVDGLTASYIAGLHNAPILYTDATSTPAGTTAEMQKLGVTSVYVVGGTSVVSQSQIDNWKSNGLSVTSYGGTDRYATAALAADAGTPGSTVFVASGEDGHLADALAVGPIAYASHYPIVLVKAGSVPDATNAELTKLAKTTVVVGGSTAVSDTTMASVRATTRLGGANRSQSAEQVADWAIANAGFLKTGVALVGSSDANAADALVAAPVAGGYKIPVLFAGTSDTNGYLSAHSASLTGTGEVFGGPGAVPQAAIDAATSAAKTAVAASAYTVINTGVSNSTFTYADPTSKKAVNMTIKSTDTFSVGGSSSSQGAFLAALHVGDTVSFTTTGSVTAYSLMNGYPSGLVKASSGTTVTIEDSILGTTLTGGAITTNTTGSVYKVDGSVVDLATFNANLSVGDSITYTVDGSGNKTFLLTSNSITGTVTDPTTTAIILKTAAGLSFTLPTTASPGASDTFSIDGVTKTATQWAAALTAGTVTAGDQITYSKSGGIQHWALVNAAPAAVTGIGNTAVNTSATTIGYWDAPGHSTTLTLSGNVSVYKINGTVATQTEFLAADAPGSWITYQPINPDDSSSVGSLSLTTKPLSGTISVANSAAHTVTILDGDGDSLAAGLAYNSNTSVYSAGAYLGSSATYTVDGTTATLTQFDSAINSVQRGSRTGTITISLSGGVVSYALATTVNANATVMSGLVATTSAATVVFNRPVALVSGQTLATTDFTYSASGGTQPLVTAAPTVNSAGQVAIAFSTAATTSNTVTVTLTATGAAKLVDANGSIPVTGSVSAGV